MIKPLRLVSCIGILVVVLAILVRLDVFTSSKTININLSSTLTKAIDIAELSTAEFKYRGIADIYTDESRTQILCRACYNAVVKAGIDMKKVRFDVDSSKKNVIATLPNIDLKVNILDEQSIALLPSDADVDIGSLLKYSKEDAENEAKNSTELVSTAQDNLKATIEGLLYPILTEKGYSLAWK